MKLTPDKKRAGILVPVFSLRGAKDLGIGDTGALQELIGWAKSQSIGAIQILPINEPGSDHSPYNLLSAMALDPLTIHTVPGELPGLSVEAFERIQEAHPVSTEGSVDYPAVKALKESLLEAAFEGFLESGGDAEFLDFQWRHQGWLADYSLHRALVDLHGGSEVSDTWPAEHRSPQAAKTWLAGLPEAEKQTFTRRVEFRAYVQWVAHSQWSALRDHADREGITIVGDVPVGVSRFSADVWCDPHLFDLTRASGAPPERVFRSDPFTEQWGQNWGFPLYNWEAMSHDNFLWWRRRLRMMLSLFHLLRVDHALGFFRIYSFPWRPKDNARFIDLSPEEASALTGGPLPGFVDRDDSTEENREHNRRHGEMVFQFFCEEAAPFQLLAEDLGEVAPYVRPSLEKLGIPGFKIPQWEMEGGEFQPGDSYRRLSLATFGTHDHPPIRTFWEDLYRDATSEDPSRADAALAQQQMFMKFCGEPTRDLPQPFTEQIHKAFLRGLLGTNSWLAVHMITDLFGSGARFNVPGSIGGQNWTCRIPEPISEWSAKYGPLLRFFRDAIRATGRQP